MSCDDDYKQSHRLCDTKGAHTRCDQPGLDPASARAPVAPSIPHPLTSSAADNLCSTWTRISIDDPSKKSDPHSALLDGDVTSTLTKAQR